MKHFYIIAGALIVGGFFSAQASQKVGKSNLPNFSRVKTELKGNLKVAPLDTEIITSTPEGEESLLASSSDAFTVEGYEATHSRVYGSGVKMVTDGNDVYFSHIVAEYPIDTWVAATRQGDKITIKGGQPVYLYYDYDTEEEVTIYLVPMKVQIDDNQQGTFLPAEENEYVFNVAADGTLTSADPKMLLGLCSYTAAGDDAEPSFYWGGYGDRDITMTPVTASTVELPAGLTPETWVFSDNYEKGIAKVAVSGNDIYVQGMCRNLKDAWVKGSIKDGYAVFNSGQYLGYDAEIFYVCYFMGAEIAEVENQQEAALANEAKFKYDAANKKLELVQGYMVNGSDNVLYPLYIYEGVTIAAQNRNPSAPPAAPYDLYYTPGDEWDVASVWVQIPNVDVDGNLLDEEMLFYQIIIDGEIYTFDPEEYYEFTDPITMVPYNTDGFDIFVEGQDHTVYLYTEAQSSVSVRSIYVNEYYQELYSEDATEYLNGIADTFADKEVDCIKYYDLSGKRVASNSKGIIVRTTTFTDGTRRVQKVVNY